VREAMQAELTQRQVAIDDWIVEIGGEGARVMAVA
jgi:hypothetical protein